MRTWWPRSADRDRPHPLEAAIRWLDKQAVNCGLPGRPGGPPCPGATAALLPTLLEFGQLELVHRLSAWLIASQRGDGSFPSGGANRASLFNTAQALGALIGLATAKVALDHQPAVRAAQYLASKLESEPEALPLSDCGARRLRTAIEVTCLPPLLAAARHFGSSCWRQTVDRITARAGCAVDWHAWTGSNRLLAHAVDAWIALGYLQLARDSLRWPSAAQRPDGAVPAERRGKWGDTVLLAHLAALWYQLGERDRADRALAFLHGQQLASGGWPDRWGRRNNVSDSAWALKHYLDAALLQVATAFACPPAGLPQTIDSGDGRFVAVHHWFGCLAQTAKVADIGCGPGRFLRKLSDRFPTARLVGIDPSPAMLQQLPPEIEVRHGSLLRVPARDGEFEGVFAVESLEHSLLPERAVSELCRVVRPGGRILIIDKHLGRQPLSLHAPWERWFLPETVATWLAPHCSNVRVRPIAHGPDSQETGLFLAWEATRLVGSL